MNRTALFLIIVLLQSFTVLAQNTGQKLSSAEITFVFVSKDVEGHISGFRSSSTLDFTAIEKSVLKGSVEVGTLKTGNFLRDWSLKGGKYFNADEYPEITFEGTSISATDKGLSVEGQLTIKGITKSISIAFAKKANQLIGTTTLFSSDFGIDIKNERPDNKVNVQLVFSLESTE